jgi:hypothetical protein
MGLDGTIRRADVSRVAKFDMGALLRIHHSADCPADRALEISDLGRYDSGARPSALRRPRRGTAPLVDDLRGLHFINRAKDDR